MAGKSPDEMRKRAKSKGILDDHRCEAAFETLDVAKHELIDVNGNYRAVDDVCKYCRKTITAEQKLELLK